MITRAQILFFLVLIAGLAPIPALSQTTGYPPPGRMVDIGGRRLHILSSGKGGPTVVLVAGGGAFAIDWTLVQSKIESSVRVCSYDRAGLGWSDPGPDE